MCTFAAWVKWNGGGAWQRIFDFGADTTRYAFLTPRAGNGKLRFAITVGGTTGERTVDAPVMLPSNVWTHVAVVLDGRQAVLYVNGRAVAVNNSVNLLPSDVLGNANYIGRSHFASDPYFRGQIDSVLIASSALPIEQIAASPISITRSNGLVNLSWPAFDTGLVMFMTTNLAPGAKWTKLTNAPVTTNGIRFLTLPASNTERYFRLSFP
ncbi:MAG: LamG domain-containing protein, partial [Verrucomicrobiae bacterium]|nr:LamG domain-containing protein [Verrucomicrobiae bacterium]